MSRSSYSDDLDQWDLIRWRGQVASAIRGKRGQEFLRELELALETLPVKRLVRNVLEVTGPQLPDEGNVCAIGALGTVRGVDLSTLDPEDTEGVAETFDIARQLAAEVVYENDEGVWKETSAQRYARMLAWVRARIRRQSGLAESIALAYRRRLQSS